LTKKRVFEETVWWIFVLEWWEKVQNCSWVRWVFHKGTLGVSYMKRWVDNFEKDRI